MPPSCLQVSIAIRREERSDQIKKFARITAKLSEGKTTGNWKSWVAGGCLVMVRLIKKQLGGI